MELAPTNFGIGRLFWLTTDAIVGADVETERIVLWNPAAEQMFGYSTSEALEMPLSALVAPGLQEAHLAGVRRYRDGGTLALVGRPPVEVPAVAKGGRPLEVALTLTDVSPEGHRKHVVAVIRDVTDVRRAQRDLERVNDSMREFIATATHDLRNPLTTILGFAEMLHTQDGSIAAEQRQQIVGAIARNATRASRLVNDLLTLSQIDAGAVGDEPETVDVAEAASEAIQMAGVGASLAVAPGLQVVVDRHHLGRMLTNLLSNADRYGRRPIEVHADRREDGVEIRVVDAGDGVPEAFVPRLFGRFTRADHRGEGTGLGLSIVKELAVAHGGDAFYEVPGAGGACFGIRLPAAP